MAMLVEVLSLGQAFARTETRPSRVSLRGGSLSTVLRNPTGCTSKMARQASWMPSLVPPPLRPRVNSNADASATADESHVIPRLPRGLRSASEDNPSHEADVEEVTVDPLQCDHCERTLKSAAGKTNHMRRAHAVVHHQTVAAVKPKRTDWSPEELHLLATDFVELKASGFKGDVSKELCQSGKTDRPYNTVRKVMSDPRFLDAVESAKTAARPSPPTPPPRSPSPPVSPTPSSRPT